MEIWYKITQWYLVLICDRDGSDRDISSQLQGHWRNHFITLHSPSSPTVSPCIYCIYCAFASFMTNWNDICYNTSTRSEVHLISLHLSTIYNERNYVQECISFRDDWRGAYTQQLHTQQRELDRKTLISGQRLRACLDVERAAKRARTIQVPSLMMIPLLQIFDSYRNW